MRTSTISSAALGKENMNNIKDLLSRLALLCRLESAIVAELESINSRLYALEENRKLKDAAIIDLKKEVGDIKLTLRQKVAV